MASSVKPCIICVAITGSYTTKKHNPAVPISVTEQIESTQAAFEMGASICHAHVRNLDESPSSDPDKFAELKIGLEKYCPGMIIQFSTGGRSASGKDRGGMLPLKPDMASLTVGSNNFPTRVYENPPELIDWLASEMLLHDILPEIEAFDLSHIFQAAAMHADGRLKGEWCGAGIAAGQHLVNEWCVSAGGHARTGFEDNVRLDRQTLAPSNAALVQRVVELCDKYERPVAQPSQARSLLGIT